MTLKVLYLAVIGCPLLGGCMGSQQTKLYNMKDGSASALVVDSPASSTGALSGKLASGAACHGSFSEVDAANAQKLAGPELLFTDNASASIAELRCDSGTVLRCTMARRAGDAFSYGACRDQGGGEYSMVF